MITFKNVFSLCTAFMCFLISHQSNAQQWNGSNSPNGSIWRPGNVWVGVEQSSRPFHVRGENMIFQIDRDRRDPGFGITRYSNGFGEVWKSFTFYVEGTGVDEGKFIIGDWHNRTSGLSDARFVIDNTGNVGIGTEDPTERLHVRGLIRARQLVMGRNEQTGPLFIPALDGVFLRNAIASPTGAFIRQNNSGRLSITAHNSQEIEFGAANPGAEETTMTLYSNGNLGLGTIGGAQHKLDVRGNIYLPNHAIFSEGGSRLNFGTAGFGNENTDITLAIVEQGEFRVRANGSQAMVVSNSEGDNGRVTFNYNVGIGTSNPTAHLTVNGRILAEEIEVIDNVPSSDYVFEDDYNLYSLEEVEAFVKKHKHLPEVPSAQEFKENGYKLGDMDDLLLRKVEELTLYMIDLKKENELLKSKVSKLENRK